MEFRLADTGRTRASLNQPAASRINEIETLQVRFMRRNHFLRRVHMARSVFGARVYRENARHRCHSLRHNARVSTEFHTYFWRATRHRINVKLSSPRAP